MCDPLVSVIICVFNAGRFLRPALESVLKQTYSNSEILIVDDGSTDGCIDSINEVSDPRIRIYRQENQGKPAALNAALEQMRGDFYALNDADDLSHLSRIERQVRCMQANPDIAALYCGHEIILDEKRMAPQARMKGRDACARNISEFRMPALDPTGMYRVSKIRGMAYDPQLPVVEGFDYVLRVGEVYPMMVLGECLYSYRVHAQSVTRRDPRRRDQLVREVRRRACVRRGIDFEMAFPGTSKGSCSHAFLDNNLAVQFIESALDQRRSGRRWGAICTGLRCSRLHPLSLHYQKAFIYATAPRWLISRVRRGRI